MFKVTNETNNILYLSDGKLIEPLATRELAKVGEKDRQYESRRWLTITETIEPEKTVEPPAEPKVETTKKGDKK